MARSTLEGHIDWVSAVAFSVDSQLLASASYDRPVRLWGIKMEETIQTCDTENIIDKLSFASDSSYLETNRGVLQLKYSTLCKNLS